MNEQKIEHIIQAFSEYDIAIDLGVTIFIGWIVAYLLCWVGQWAVAFVGDSKVGGINKLAEKLNYSKWKYPVYNEGEEKASKKREARDRPFGYSKEGFGASCHGLDHGSDYWYGQPGFLFVVLLTSAAPFLIILSVKFYPVTLFILTAIVIMYITRMIVRHKKLFDKHIKDTDAHN